MGDIHRQQGDLISLLYFFKIRNLANKMNEKTEACSMHVENPKGIDQVGGGGIDGREILKWVLGK
jgi:hypothetical protein